MMINKSNLSIVIMKKIVLILTTIFICILTSCDPDTGSSTTRAGIMAEGFVEEDVLSSEDLVWNIVGVDETATDEYHVVANIKTLNGLGLLVPRKVSVRLKYIGGEWTDQQNWSLISIKYLDESTGRQYSSY